MLAVGGLLAVTALWLEPTWHAQERAFGLRMRDPAEVAGLFRDVEEALESLWASAAPAVEIRAGEAPGERDVADARSEPTVEEELTWKDRRQLDRLVETTTGD